MQSNSRWARLLVVVGILAGLTVGVVSTAAAGEPGANPFVQVRIDQVSPQVATTTSEPVVTVAGTVTNIGDRPVHDLMLRLERAPAVPTSTGLRTNLDGDTDQYEAAMDFATVSPVLQRGQKTKFTLSAPMRSAGKHSLDITAPGVYPLLVNVNGTPDYGEPARLDNARFLLPVLGVPPDPLDTSGDALAAVVAPDTSKPVPVTMLWPLADRPRLAPGVPGGTIPVRLMDDELAGALASGGRLDVLLSAAEFATSHDVDPDGAVGRSVCLAVDPDLLITVNAMTAGYVVSGGVSGSPAGPAQEPGTPTHPGAGQAAAAGWLNRLRALAHRVCVAPLPYAQADLDAVQRIGEPGLSATATSGAADIVDQILGVAAVRGATLIPEGSLSRRGVDLLSANGNTVVIAAAYSSVGDSNAPLPPTPDTAPRRLSPQVVLAPFDPAVGAAFAAAGSDPVAPSYLDNALLVRFRHDSDVARRQDALGSMLWRALQPKVNPRAQVLLPPTNWNLRPDDAGAIMTALATAIRSGLAVPRPLPALINEASAVPPVNGTPQPEPDGGGRGRFGDAVVTRISGEMGRLAGLTAALTTDTRTGLTGVSYTAPLREDMLRAVSQADPPDTRNGLAQQRLDVVAHALDDLFGAVTIVTPTGSYTLATEHSPLPLALHNGLAVPIRVRLHLAVPPGMTVTDPGEIELPPGYLPMRVPIEVNFTQRVAIDATLHTPDGVPLGEMVRLSVHSNAYGKVLFAITMSAAAVLVALAGRRLWHRFRGQPDRADLDRPDPHDAGIDEEQTS
jgi:hypothetical protein